MQSTVKRHFAGWAFWAIGTVAVFLMTFPVASSASAGTGDNLVKNPSVEMADANDPSIPSGWSKEKWWNNTAVFTYTDTGAQDGNRAVKVRITKRSGGDAKWTFGHVPAVPGTEYEFSDQYRSDVPTELVAEYRKTGGAVAYVSLGTVSPAVQWTAASKRFTVPASVTSMTIYHIIRSVWTLETDAASLFSATVAVPPPPVPTTGNLILNPSMETVSESDGLMPAYWDYNSWGSNVAAFSYPVPGLDDGKWAGIQVSSFKGGDAKWLFRLVPVIPGETYEFSDSYKSDVPTLTTVEYRTSSGVATYANLGKPPASPAWSRYSGKFIPPPFAAEARVLHRINRNGYLNTDGYSLVRITGSGSGTWVTIRDTVPPSIAMMSPGASGLAFSGVLSLSARASDDTGVSGVVFFVDDTAFGSGSTGTGSSDVFTLLLDSTSLANGEHSVYSTAYDAAGNSGSTERRLLRIENPVPDTVAPTVSIVSPTAGSILSGTGTLSITASDDVGIVSVRYSITNGQNLTIGRFDEPPYVVTIPADALKNGSHTITAYAEDAAGNIGNASPVRYNTYYVPPEPQNPNLIANPSLETGNGGIPDAWTKGGWGNNVASFSYPVTGTDGQYAAEISMSEWTNGDAKWYFSDVPVTGGANYSFSDWYKSTVPSELTIRYAYADGSYSYAAIVSRLPASADWINAVQTLTVPPNAVKATVFHLISGVGTLTIDQAEFRLASAGGTPGPNSFPTGLVSFSFDDGWASQYDNAVPALDAAGIRGSFYIITDEMGAATNPNRLSNPSFEIADSASLPASWSGHAEGGATATFSYPVSGIASGKAAKVEMNSYSGGTAGWQSDPVTAANGESYNFSDRYLSDVPTQVTVEYAMSDSTVRERILGTVPASGIWADARFSFVVPANVRRLSVRHCLASAGTLVTDEYRLGLSRNYMDLDQLQSIQRAGHEIGSHSKTHPFLTGLSEADASDEISWSRQDLLKAGFSPIRTFVYPYGDYNPSIVSAVSDAGYSGARSVDFGFNDKSTDRYALKTMEINSSTTLEQLESWTRSAMDNRTWLILMFHQVDNSGNRYGTSPAQIQSYVDFLVDNGIPTVTLWQGIELMGK